MRIIKCLILIQCLAVLFLLVPNTWDWPSIYYNDTLIIERGTTLRFSMFPFVDIPIYLRTYAWHFFNRVNLAILYFLIYTLIHAKYKIYVYYFLLMEVALIIEYLLSYNSTWFGLPLFGRIGLSHFFIIFKALILTNAIWEQSK